ncbi:MAG: YafY family transcriptional regulator [Proteobacteria bacterium]|nr:YafY family transcriptional regulator [Pseudomonadota bacterium]
MSRAARLLDLLQAFRRHRRPATAAALAEKLGVSQRTLYRDIATLQAQGALIEGEAGTGYVLKEGHFLPPLSFSDDEIDALVLGLRWVTRNTDLALAQGAFEALAKIAAVLPADMRMALESERVFAATDRVVPEAVIDANILRDAIRRSRKLRLTYRGGEGSVSERIVWPLALAFFNDVCLVIAWCELRQDFRHFRADRIVTATPTSERIPKPRRALLQEWQKREGHGSE